MRGSYCVVTSALTHARLCSSGRGQNAARDRISRKVDFGWVKIYFTSYVVKFSKDLLYEKPIRAGGGASRIVRFS